MNSSPPPTCYGCFTAHHSTTSSSFKMRLNTIFFYAIVSCQGVLGHPGEDHAAEVAARQAYLRNNIANLDHCAGKLQERGVSGRGLERRSQLASELRAKRGITAGSKVERSNSGDHVERGHIDVDVDPSVLFSGNSSCVLAPEEILGPYCKSCHKCYRV